MLVGDGIDRIQNDQRAGQDQIADRIDPISIDFYQKTQKLHGATRPFSTKVLCVKGMTRLKWLSTIWAATSISY